MWSVGLVETLAFPSDTCDWNAFWEDFHKGNRIEFLQRLELRAQCTILDEADLIYRLHWAAKDAGFGGRNPPAGLNSSVVMERHYALNWLIAPTFEPYAWDEVPTDT